MRHILVTGGTGALGTVLVPQLVAAGHAVRVMSRRDRPPSQDTTATWARADLETGEGLADAVAGIDVIVHAASLSSGKTEQVDVHGTRRLIERAQAAGVAHIVYVSIVGIDRVPFSYYRHKLAAEAIVSQGGVPWSILRATQFHPFVAGLLGQAVRLPIIPLPTDLLFQPIDIADVAQCLCHTVEGEPAGRLPDIGGPEVLRLGEIAETWRCAGGIRRPIVHVPLPGAFASALRQGANTCPGQRTQGMTWAAWCDHQKE